MTVLRQLTMAAALHFDLAIANFGIQEQMVHSEQMGSIFKRAYLPVNRLEQGRAMTNW